MLKKVVTLFLTVIVLLSSIQISVFAANNDESNETIKENSSFSDLSSEDVLVEQIEPNELPFEVPEQESDFSPAALEERKEPYTPIDISLNPDGSIQSISEKQPINGIYEVYILEEGEVVFNFDSSSIESDYKDTKLIPDTVYFISVIVTDGDIRDSYDGYFSVVNASIVYDYIFHSTIDNSTGNSEVQSVSPLASTQYESESNNTYSSADILVDGNKMLGYINTANDRDWYRISFAKDGDAVFSLTNIPSGTNYNMTIYKAANTYSTPTVLYRCTNSIGINENWRTRVDSELYYYVEVFSVQGFSASSRYYLTAKNTPITDNYEINDTTAKATAISTNGTYYANIHDSKDIDYYKLTLSSGGRVSISLANIPSGTNYDLELYNSSNAKLAGSNKAGTMSESISQALQSGTYYIKVFSISGSSYTSNYKLSVVTASNTISIRCAIKPNIPENANSYSGIATAIKSLPIKLYSINSLGRATFISEGTTDSLGYYSKSGVNVSGDIKAIRIQVVFNNSDLCVKQQNGTIYSFDYDIPLGANSSIDVTLPNQTSVPEEQILAYALWKNGMDCISLHKSISSVSLGKLEFRSSVGTDGTKCTNSILGSYISIGGLSSHKAYLNKDVILHEIGHWMMYKQGLMPSGTGGNHGYGSACATKGAAYAEGWATFYSCAARKSAQMMDYFSSASSNYGANLSSAQYYSYGWKSLPLKSTPAENQMFELNVGSILWAYKNYYSYASTQALTSPKKQSLEDIYNSAISSATTSVAKEAVWEMFNERGCAFDTTVPTVSLSVTGNTASASASDDVAVKKLVWLVNGEQVKTSDTDSDSLDLSGYPGLVTVEVRAYDLEGLEDRSWLREQRYASNISTAYIYSDNPIYAGSKAMSFDSLLLNEGQQELQTEKMIDIGNDERYSITTDGEKDIYIHGHIIGGVNRIDIYDPNGNLVDTVKYISPDNPYIIKQAMAGTWTIEVVALSELDMHEILEMADLPTFSYAEMNNDRNTLNDELCEEFIIKEEIASPNDSITENTIQNNASIENDSVFEDSEESSDANSVSISNSVDLNTSEGSSGNNIQGTSDYTPDEGVTDGESCTYENLADSITDGNSTIDEAEDGYTADEVIIENLETDKENLPIYEEFAERVKNEFSTKVLLVLSTKPSKIDCEDVVYTSNPLYLYDLLSTKNGAIVQERGNNIDFAQPLADGNYELELFRSIDGTTSDISNMILIVDTIAPEIEFTNDFETHEEGIYLDGICSKDTAGAWIDGIELSLSEFTDDPLLGVYLELALGKNEMELTLVDQAGNTTTKKLIFTRAA